MYMLFVLIKTGHIPTKQVWTGSAVLLKNGKAVTANHVVDMSGSPIVVATNNAGVKAGCKILANDRERDLALIDCAGFSHVNVHRGYASMFLPIGTRVSAAGFPLGGPLVISDGVASNHLFERGKYMFSVPAGPGMSGGGVFTYSGLLVGVIQSGYGKPPFTLFTSSPLQLARFLKESGYEK